MRHSSVALVPAGEPPIFPSMNYLYLIVAVIAEVVATSALAASHGFTKPMPSLVTVVGYGIAFYLLSLTLRTIPVGIVYAVWSGLGIVLIAAVGAIWFRQPLDLSASRGPMLAELKGGAQGHVRDRSRRLSFAGLTGRRVCAWTHHQDSRIMAK